MKYYQIREVRKNKKPKTENMSAVLPVAEKSIKTTDTFTAAESETGKSRVWMNEAQTQAVKRSSAGERFVLWCFRWSQVMFWAGLVLVAGEMCLMIAASIVDMPLFTEWQKSVLYIIGSVGGLMFVFGALVDWYTINTIDERSERRMRNK